MNAFLRPFHAAAVLAAVAVLALPLADLALAVLRRTAKGTSPFSADRGHLHHKLVDGGYTQAQAVALLPRAPRYGARLAIALCESGAKDEARLIIEGVAAGACSSSIISCCCCC